MAALNRKSRSPGQRLIRNVFETALPLSLLPTLRWLINPARGISDRWVLQLARTRGLLKPRSLANISVNGERVVRAVRRAQAQVPATAHELAEILHGIGELAAHTNVEFKPVLERFFTRWGPNRPSQIKMSAVLKVIEKYQDVRVNSGSLDSLGLGQAVVSTEGNDDTLRTCVARLRHGSFHRDRNYGAKLVAKLVANKAPHAIDRWLLSCNNKFAISTVVCVVIGRLMRNDAQLARALLRFRNTFLKYSGVAYFLSDRDLVDPQHICSCLIELRTGGVAEGEAVWMVCHRLHDLVIAGSGAISMIEHHSRVLDNFRSQAPAFRLDHGSLSEQTAREESELNRIVERLAALDLATEEGIKAIARSWPAAGLTDAQTVEFDRSFSLEFVEHRHRLALLLPNPEKFKLLKANIRSVHILAGSSKSGEGQPAVWNLSNAKDVMGRLKWSALSLIEFSKDEARGIGKRTSDQLKVLEENTGKWLNKPFAARRNFTNWEKSVQSTVVGYLFAMSVLESTPPEKADQITGLRRLLLQHAVSLFTRPVERAGPRALFDAFICGVVSQLDHDPALEPIRMSTIANETLSDFPRGLFLWSSLEAVRTQRTKALDLLSAIGTEPLYLGARPNQLGRLMCILDVAISAALQNNDEVLLGQISGRWAEIYPAWSQLLPEGYSDCVQKVARAVAHPGPERELFFTSPRSYFPSCEQLGQASIKGTMQR